MQKCVGVSKKTLTNLAGLPRFRRGFQRHVDHHRSADQILARHAAPKAAVHRVAAVVAHDEITMVGDHIRILYVGSANGILAGRSGLAGSRSIGLDESLAVNPHRAVANIQGFAGKSDDAFHEVRLIWGERRLENYDLLALGIAP